MRYLLTLLYIPTATALVWAADEPVSTQPVVTATMPAQPSPAVDLPGSYILVWRDEFDGTELDRTKWNYRGLGPRRDAINTRASVSVADGRLTITTARHTTEDRAPEYHTGMIATNGLFEPKYGYFEARIKMHSARGHWGAFWLNCDRMGNPVGDPAKGGVEVDVIEYHHNGPDGQPHVQHALHWDGYRKDHKSAGRRLPPRNLHDAFHVFGMRWTPDGYEFYVDGRRTWRCDKAVSKRGQYLLLSCEVGRWAGAIGQAKLPDSMVVDYVRVYQRSPDKRDAGTDATDE